MSNNDSLVEKCLTEAARLLKKNKPIPKVFLGGTCNNSPWRNKLIEMLEIDYFNPVVDDWTPECMKEEIKQRKICDYCLYVITPSMTGVYSIAEVIDDSNKQPEKTLFCVLKHEISSMVNGSPYYPTSKVVFSNTETKSLNQVGEMVKRNGGKTFESLREIADYLNGQIK
jgi:hypothetical protein